MRTNLCTFMVDGKCFEMASDTFFDSNYEYLLVGRTVSKRDTRSSKCVSTETIQFQAK